MKKMESQVEAPKHRKTFLAGYVDGNSGFYVIEDPLGRLMLLVRYYPYGNGSHFVESSFSLKRETVHWLAEKLKEFLGANL